jgi:hypothetical protein
MNLDENHLRDSQHSGTEGHHRRQPTPIEFGHGAKSFYKSFPWGEVWSFEYMHCSYLHFQIFEF